MATMKDVAKLAGVSLGTVSNVLNNRASVLPENRERVMAAVKELGFRSNMVARTLKTKASNDIGLIIPDISNPFYPELARGVEDEANKAGLTVFLCNNDRSAKKERQYIDSLLTKNVCGLIMVKPLLPLEELNEIAQWIEVVLADVDVLPNARYHIVNVDEEGGVTQGMEYLHQQMGHDKIGFINGMLETPSSRKHHSAYKKYLAGCGLPYREDYVAFGDYNWSGGANGAKQLIAVDDPPTAIFATNDIMAIGCMKMLYEMGLSIPRDISVLGFDNIDMSNFCIPPLTTISHSIYEIGTTSVQMLLQSLESADTHRQSEHRLLSTSVVQRSSVAPLAK